MKSLLRIAISALLACTFVGCDNDTGNSYELLPLRLTLNKETIAPFEVVTCFLNISNYDEMGQHYDSILWYGEGPAGNYTTGFSRPAVSFDEPFSINLTDCVAGSHEITAKGYKDGEVISEDSATYIVVSPACNDFYNIKWGSATHNSAYCCIYGACPFRQVRIEILLGHHVDNGTEYAKLESCPWIIRYPEPIDWSDDDQHNFHKTIFDLTPKHISSIYGEPILRYIGDDVWNTHLRDDFVQRFNYELDGPDNIGMGEYPVAIWETHTSNIAMLARTSCNKGLYMGQSYLIAEPKKQNNK